MNWLLVLLLLFGALQVFKSIKHLESLLSLRSRYVLTVLIDAKDSFSTWGIDVPANFLKLLEKLGSLMKMFPSSTGAVSSPSSSSSSEPEAAVHLITAFDNLQPPSSWVQSWVRMLSSCSDFDELLEFLETNTGIERKAAAEQIKKETSTSTPPSDVLVLHKAESDSQDAQVKVQGAQEETGDVGVDTTKKQKQDEPADDKSGGRVDIDTINTFVGMSEKGSTFLQHSDHARSLDMDDADCFSAQGLKVLEHKLTCALWKAFDMYSVRNNSVFVNLMTTDNKSRVQVKRPVPSELCLPFAGPITQNPQVTKDSKGFHLCTLFGVPFYVSSQPADVMSHEVVVPAWAVRNVTKADQAYFIQESTKAQLLLLIPDHISCPSLLDVEVVFVDPSMPDEKQNALMAPASQKTRLCFLSDVVRKFANLSLTPRH